METENLDLKKSGYEAKIYSKDRKYQKEFKDLDFLERINACLHPTSLRHEKKDLILEVEKLLLPLKSQASKLVLEAKGGSVIARMTLEDFFNLLELAKRIEIINRDKESATTKEVLASVADEVQELLSQIGNE